MYFLESSSLGKHQVWRYALLILIVYAAIQVIGGLPLIIYLTSLALENPEAAIEAAETYNFGKYSLELNIFPFIIGIVAIALLIKPIHKRSIGQLINGGQKFRWDRFFKGYIVWLGMSAIYLAICLAVFPADFELNNLSSTLIHIVVVSLFLIPFQAAFEEILTRGYFMQGFYVLTQKRWAAILFTSLIFALLHIFNPEVKELGFATAMAQYLLFGLLFGAVAVFDDGVEASIGLHSANNAFLCIMVTNESSALQTPALLKQVELHPWFDFAVMLFMSFAALFILSKILHWKQSYTKEYHLQSTNGI